MSTEPNSQGTQAETSAHRPVSPRALRPRTGPIVWGALVLVFCAFVIQQTLAPGTVDGATWAIAAVIGLGMLLLVVGLAVILRSRR